MPGNAGYLPIRAAILLDHIHKLPRKNLDVKFSFSQDLT